MDAPGAEHCMVEGQVMFGRRLEKYDEATQHMHSNGPHDSATPDEINGGVGKRMVRTHRCVNGVNRGAVMLYLTDRDPDRTCVTE